MTYATEHIAASLRAARRSKGLSQRDLAQLAGVPHCYISKVESGRVDLRLSSLVDIARALDLELALVPRKAMPAVQSIARPSQSWQFPAGSFPSLSQLKQIQANLSQVSHANPTLKELAQLHRQVRDLQHLRLPPPDLEALRKATVAIRSLDVKAPDLDAIRQALPILQEMRNRIVHAIPKIEPPRPAYALDENDNE
jgi:transcriptional regulator with XRE-family HTH domain